MKIQPVVEGDGEVHAVPVLLRRLIDACGAYDVGVGRPIKRTRHQLTNEFELARSVRLAGMQDDCAAILVLLDADNDCPKELAPTLRGWANSAAAGVPCAVVMAEREFEAWFLAAIESLRGTKGILDDALPHPDPETPRGAKERLEERMAPGRTYSETADQASLTATFDLAVAYQGCRSFRTLVTSFGSILAAAGRPLAEWPPADWK